MNLEGCIIQPISAVQRNKVLYSFLAKCNFYYALKRLICNMVNNSNLRHTKQSLLAKIHRTSKTLLFKTENYLNKSEIRYSL